MPIRLNLLAESQAAEELRRRDPVKRALWAGIVIIALLGCWSFSLQFKVVILSTQVSRVHGALGSHTNAYQAVISHQQQIAETKKKITALKRLSSTRFLNGPLLNALQLSTVPDVQLLRASLTQTYTATAEVKPQNEDGNHKPGKPATATEAIILTLDASDTSANPGDQVTKLKDALACNAYFKDKLVHNNPVVLKSLSPQQLAPGSGLPCVLFSLQCRFPDHTR